MQLRSWDDERRYNKRIFGGQARVVSNTVVCLGRSGSGWCGALWCNGATVVPRCLSIKTRDTTLRYQADSGLRHWSAHITISITIPTLNPLDFVADFLSFHFLRLLKPIEMSFGGAGKQSWKKLHRISLLHFGISNTSYLDNTISTFHRFQRRSWWSVRDHRLCRYKIHWWCVTLHLSHAVFCTLKAKVADEAKD